MNSSVHPIHFEDRSGQEFERLSFAYILRYKNWKKIDWYGQLGKDSGRDIWGTSDNGLTYCYQCANFKNIMFKKAQTDIDKICQGAFGRPENFIMVVGGKISAQMKERIEKYAHSKGINNCEVWSGIEFEERLRRDTPDLIRRFFEGEAFPESVNDLRGFINSSKVQNDEDILASIAECFDRPAFSTPFYLESNLPDFKKAITDTIEALKTGIRRLRDGTIITKMPTKNNLQNDSIKDVLTDIEVSLVRLRTMYDEGLRTGEIRPCGCGQDNCPIHMISHRMCSKMDDLRTEILRQFREIYPSFNVKFGL